MNGFDLSTISGAYIGSNPISAIYLGSNKIWPTTPHDYSQDYFTIEAITPGTVTIDIDDSESTNNAHRTIYYSIDNGDNWTEFQTGYDGSTLATLNAGDKLLIKGNNNNYGLGGHYYNYFGGTAQTKVYGNTMSLLYGDNFINKTAFPSSSNSQFVSLFRNYTNLIDASNLILPALEMRAYSYSAMFYGCTSLINAPKLPATTLANLCYNFMFCGCTSLTTAPDLLAQTLASLSYADMFKGCTNLNYIKMTAITTNTTVAASWVEGVSSTGTFVKNAATTSLTTGIDGIPAGWTVQDV